MLGRAHPALPVGRPDRDHPGRRLVRRVDEHVRDAVVVQPRVLRGGQLRQVEQHPRGAARGQLVEPAALRGGAPGPVRPGRGPPPPDPPRTPPPPPRAAPRPTRNCPASAAPGPPGPAPSTCRSGAGAHSRAGRGASVTRRRVSGATSSRPLTTFDAVGTDTPASRATTASVGPAATLALSARTDREPPLRPARGPPKVATNAASAACSPTVQKALPKIGARQHGGKTGENAGSHPQRLSKLRTDGGGGRGRAGPVS